jgi:uncharacterized membrane protein YgcG
MIIFILVGILIIHLVWLENLRNKNKARIILLGLDNNFVKLPIFKKHLAFVQKLSPEDIESIKANPYSKSNWDRIHKIVGLRSVALLSGLSATEVSRLSRFEIESRFSKSSNSSGGSSSSDSDFGGGGGFDGGGAGGSY